MPRTIKRKRVTSTKDEVQNALLKLLNDGKRLEEISVKNICEEAGIFRTTFYRYYTDIYSCYKDIEIRLLNFILEETRSQLQDNSGKFIPLTLFEFIDQNPNVALVILSSSGPENLLDKVFEEIKKIYMSSLYFKTLHLDEGESILRFIFGGAKEIVYCWLKDGKKESFEDISKEIEKLCLKAIS